MAEDPAETADDSHLPMMERRPWTRRLNRLLPLRFRDVLPQPPPPLPLAHVAEAITPLDIPPSVISPDRDSHLSQADRAGSPLYRIFSSPRNIFGLFRRYYAKNIPTYDPEADISLQDLSNIPAATGHPYSTSQTFYPYPNRTAFRLGDWFWNGGVQKSQASFRELMDIVGDPEFHPSDVQDVKWDQINTQLAAEDEEEWLDEPAGWTQTPVTISVPYQPRRGIPSDPKGGPRNYVVNDFYHRSLVTVIREKLSGSSSSHLFHFEPHELLWQPPSHLDPIRVHGELYTSPAFINAHRELQDSPGQPGCDLPRVVVALMFWSDATQLTAFGSAQLWPLYLFFGNESKYRRCKPSCHLCEHIAYFQKVGLSDILHKLRSSHKFCISCRTHSKSLLLRKQQEERLQVRHL